MEREREEMGRERQADEIEGETGESNREKGREEQGRKGEK